MDTYKAQLPIGAPNHAERLRIQIENALQYHILDADKFGTWWGELVKICDKIVELGKEHPKLCEFILLTAGGAITIPLLLQIAGFSLTGPVAGSLAAWWQSTIGDVAAGSFFAWLQSIGMQPAMAVGTGALIGFGTFLWVEIIKVALDKLKGDDDGVNRNQRSAGCGRRDTNPFYSVFNNRRNMVRQ